jgi:hypothetical protein
VQKQYPEMPSTLNVCVVAGWVNTLPEWRELAKGASVTTFNLKVPQVGSRAHMVRVSWMDAPTSALDLQEGSAVLVTGHMRSYWAGRTINDLACRSITPLSSIDDVRLVLAEVMAEIQTATPLIAL